LRAGCPARFFFQKPEVRMWFDDASLLSLEEVDWKVGLERDEVGATVRDEDFLETARFDETWCAGTRL
jgi:hypothetical protein